MSGKRRANYKWDSSTEEEEEMRDVVEYEKMCKQPPSPVPSTETTRRRGRGPSKRPCLNRNALMARANRQRKKAYLEKIESKLSYYQQENKILANTIQKQGIDIKRLSGEVAYLRSVLNNNTSITALLKTINDGLRRLGKGESNSVCSSGSWYGKQEENAQKQRCTCPLNAKENVLQAELPNGFAESKEAQISESNECLSSRKCEGACKNEQGRKSNACSFSDTDHTYTAAKYSVSNGGNGVENGLENVIGASISPICNGTDSGYMGSASMKDFDSSLDAAPSSMSDLEKKQDIEMVGTDYDQLSTFNVDNIFDDLPKCDDIMNSIDNLHDATSLFNEEELFQNMDNSGVCLHINSDKVSLEFCSICHLNSKNSGIE